MFPHRTTCLAGHLRNIMIAGSTVNPVKAYKRLRRAVIRGMRSAGRAIAAKFSRGGGLPPEDPYSYVTAPKRPRLPHLSAAAVAELPKR